MVINNTHYKKILNISNMQQLNSFNSFSNLDTEQNNLYNKDVVNVGQISNKSINREYSNKQFYNNQVVFNNVDNINHIREDNIITNVDYLKHWENISPKYIMNTLPTLFSYYRQNLTNQNNFENTFNSLEITIDYDYNYMSRQQKDIIDEEQIYIHIITKNGEILKLSDIRFYDLISRINGLVEFKDIDDNLDLHIYQNMLYGIIKYCLGQHERYDGEDQYLSDIIHSTSVKLLNNVNFQTISNDKLVLDFKITPYQDTQTQEEYKTLLDISDGFNLIFVSNFKYINSKSVNTVFIKSELVNYEVDGGLL